MSAHELRDNVRWSDWSSCLSLLLLIPVVPHKAVAEVSRIGNYRRDWLL